MNVPKDLKVATLAIVSVSIYGWGCNYLWGCEYIFRLMLNNNRNKGFSIKYSYALRSIILITISHLNSIKIKLFRVTDERTRIWMSMERQPLVYGYGDYIGGGAAVASS